MNKKRFSIVIALAPWRNAEILEYIKKLNYKKSNYEVIIIKGTNVPENRNKGVKKSKGEIILFLDDDAIIEPDFLNKVDDFFKEHPKIDIAGGPQLTPKSDKNFARISGYALTDPFGSPVYKRYTKTNLNLDADNSFLTGALLICRKRIFKKIDFDEKVYPADDVNFIIRAKNIGLKVAYNPEIYVYHRRRASIREFARQIFNYGVTRPKKESFKETLKHPSFLIPPIFTIYIPLSLILYNFNTLFAYPLILYAVTNILFSLYECIKNKDIKVLPVLPLLFFIIHISYGIGFIYGSFKGFKNEN